MKKFIAISLLSILFLSAIRPYFPYLDYAVNKEYISKILCENIDKPKLKCHGKCHLEKELKKLESVNELDKKTKIKINEQDHVYIYYCSDIINSIFNFGLKDEVFTDKNNYKINSFFKPPIPPPKSLFS